MSLRTLFHKAEHRLRTSKAFTMQTDAQRVFFPGCSLTSGSPELVAEIFDYLRKSDPDIGIQLDCCGMPLTKYVGKDAGRKTHERIADGVRNAGVTEIITACGNCFVELKSALGKSTDTEIASLYDVLADNPPKSESLDSVLVHHPCPARTDPAFRESFERLTGKTRIGIDTESIRRSHALSCCLHKTPAAGKLRAEVAGSGKRVITYCAHCVKEFRNDLPVFHVLQHLFSRARGLRSRSFVSMGFAYRRAMKLLRSAGS